MSRQKKRFSALNLLWIVPLALIIAAAMIMFVIPALEGVSARGVEGSSSWMKALPDEMPLSEAVLPGTHDSATEHTQLAFFSKCQALSIREQLDAGYRYLDIRLGDDENMTLMHGFVNCLTSDWPLSEPLYLESVLNDCYSFLADNPTETIVFCVKHEHGGASDSEFADTLYSFISKKPELWYSGASIPTVGEARGKLVLLKRFYDMQNKLPGLVFKWTDQKGYADPVLNTAEYENPACKLYVQDRFEYDADEKWAAFTAGMETGEDSPTAVSLNFLSAKGHAKYGHPYKYASVLNKKLKDSSGLELRGWVIIDFASPELAERIYSANFGG